MNDPTKSDLMAVLDEIQQYGGEWGVAAYHAQRLIIELWRDVEAIRSCWTCKHTYECDPDGDGKVFEMWKTCKGDNKLNWEWRGTEL